MAKTHKPTGVEKEKKKRDRLESDYVGYRLEDEWNVVSNKPLTHTQSKYNNKDGKNVVGDQATLLNGGKRMFYNFEFNRIGKDELEK